MSDKWNSLRRGVPQLYLLLAAVIILSVILLLRHNQKNSSNLESKNSTNSTNSPGETSSKVHLKYPNGWSEKGLTNQDLKDGLILRAQRSDLTAYFFIRVLKTEINQPVNLDDVSVQTIANLKDQIPDFKLLSSQTTSYKGHQALDLQYDQSSAQLVRQNRMIIIIGARQTYYLTYTSSGVSIASLQDDINFITDSFVNSSSFQ